MVWHFLRISRLRARLPPDAQEFIKLPARMVLRLVPCVLNRSRPTVKKLPLCVTAVNRVDILLQERIHTARMLVQKVLFIKLYTTESIPIDKFKELREKMKQVS